MGQQTVERAAPSSVTRSVPSAHPEDVDVVAGLRDGSEVTFGAPIDLHQGSMLRVARIYVADRSAAEDVVEETWMTVIRGIDRFDGRSSIKTWIFRILTNRAKTMGQRASRVVPVSSLNGSAETAGPAIDADRFFDSRHAYWPGHWCSPPARWTDGPEDRAATKEAVSVVLEAIVALPPAQREVVTLRDVECWSAMEVCSLLSLSETNQRVLLHRGRSKVRRHLDQLTLDRFDWHLAECPFCQTYVEQIRATIEMAGRVDAEQMSPSVRQGLLDAFNGWHNRGPERR